MLKNTDKQAGHKEILIKDLSIVATWLWIRMKQGVTVMHAIFWKIQDLRNNMEENNSTFIVNKQTNLGMHQTHIV